MSDTLMAARQRMQELMRKMQALTSSDDPDVAMAATHELKVMIKETQELDERIIKMLV